MSSLNFFYLAQVVPPSLEWTPAVWGPLLIGGASFIAAFGSLYKIWQDGKKADERDKKADKRSAEKDRLIEQAIKYLNGTPDVVNALVAEFAEFVAVFGMGLDETGDRGFYSDMHHRLKAMPKAGGRRPLLPESSTEEKDPSA